ncbi:SMI1/KNR4 family protein [Zooshikella harenae]|uniref:Knr4/Smi1-like domain-containing protein n=1 Tax=Zooshikella harenae TaxID=2827238 RepID=A0ABS5ZJG5_9GAMM|nr:SMI1/KNR4 family protein [Zooshikella harenae]MBU2714104.1 hypothetical protein [Zooshikella harenae]
MSIKKLISISSNPLSSEPVKLAPIDVPQAGTLANELISLLSQKNGFYAFEGALHIFPASSPEDEMNLISWNDQDLWISHYKGLAEGCLFFAEDIFGGQFCIKDNKIFIFDPETGDFEDFADDFSGWAEEILGDYNTITGYPLAHQWQVKNGKLADSQRLMPKIPFVCRGEFSVENLTAINAVSGMRSRGNLAHQIHNLPDGAQIKFNIID